jgi:ABC-2 type transport system permease protein
MSCRLTLATGGRVLRQVRHDPRTVGLLIVMPCVLIGLLAWIYADTPLFDRLTASLLGIFPFITMFLVTSIATLRERQTGTLERLLSLPVGKGDFVAGYAVAFGFLALVQSLAAASFAIFVLRLDTAGPAWLLVVVALVTAVLGTALGLFVSAFATTEFQAVQFLPALVLPQFLLCGLLTPRDAMPAFLHAVSDVLPLSYAVDAMTAVTTQASATGDVMRDSGIVALYVLGAIALGSATLRRRTP